MNCTDQQGNLGHCLHEIMRTRTLDSCTINRRCCWCGDYFAEVLVPKPDPNHGPHAPKLWSPATT